LELDWCSLFLLLLLFIRAHNNSIQTNEQMKKEKRNEPTILSTLHFVVVVDSDEWFVLDNVVSRMVVNRLSMIRGSSMSPAAMRALS